MPSHKNGRLVLLVALHVLQVPLAEGLEGRWRAGETGAADLASALTGAHSGSGASSLTLSRRSAWRVLRGRQPRPGGVRGPPHPRAQIPHPNCPRPLDV